MSDHVNLSALKADDTIGGGKQRIVPSHPDVGACEKLGPALADEYGAGFYRLSGEAFYAPELGVTVSAIS